MLKKRLLSLLLYFLFRTQKTISQSGRNLNTNALIHDSLKTNDIVGVTLGAVFFTFSICVSVCVCVCFFILSFPSSPFLLSALNTFYFSLHPCFSTFASSLLLNHNYHKYSSISSSPAFLLVCPPWSPLVIRWVRRQEDGKQVISSQLFMDQLKDGAASSRCWCCFNRAPRAQDVHKQHVDLLFLSFFLDFLL